MAVQPDETGVRQIVSQETGKSLTDIKDETTMGKYAARVANACNTRFQRSIIVRGKTTFSGLKQLLGV